MMDYRELEHKVAYEIHRPFGRPTVVDGKDYGYIVPPSAYVQASIAMPTIADALRDPTQKQSEEWHILFRAYLNTGAVSEADLLNAAFSIALSPLRKPGGRL
jgi:hypothetical protein